MVRVFWVWVVVGMSLPSVEAQDNNVALLMAERQANHEDIKRLSSTVEDLLNANLSMQKKMVAMETELREMRSELSRVKETVKDTSSSYASRDSLQQLANKAQEIDKKREADKRLILEELQKLLKTPPVAYSDPAPTKSAASKSTAKQSQAPANEDGYEYEIKPGDSLTKIVNLYNKEGVKVTVDQILKANPKLKANAIVPGKKIFIPAKAE